MSTLHGPRCHPAGAAASRRHRNRLVLDATIRLLTRPAPTSATKREVTHLAVGRTDSAVHFRVTGARAPQ